MRVAQKKTPAGLWGFLLVLGPSLIWCGEYIGSGEVIIATRAGAILGPAVMWAVVGGIFLKFWIGLCGARYTVVTGEGMIDCFGRVPGPKNWLVWVVFVGQVASGICAVGALATAAATFLGSLVPFGDHTTFIWGAIVTAFAFTVAWTGGVSILKYIMTLLVTIIVVGVLYVAFYSLPPLRELLFGLFGFHVPEIAPWATRAGLPAKTAWEEILPLMGWAAGGFASQVWYSYWVLGAGYGMAGERRWGQPADEKRLRTLSVDEARQVRPWLRAVAFDATAALVIGTVVTLAFLLAGAGVLEPCLSGRVAAPAGSELEMVLSDPDLAMNLEGPKLALTLSLVFSTFWGRLGGTLFLVAGAAAMVSTQLGLLAGWPRLLADCLRLLNAKFRGLRSTTQLRLFLSLFLLTNLAVVALFGTRPVFLVKLGSIFDGLVLVPLQALAIAWGLFYGQKKLLSKEAWKLLQPRWYHAAGLVLAFLFFGYFCVFQVPQAVIQLLAG
jgi:Mn2+/Fe2+ NRAMP family transporter